MVGVSCRFDSYILHSFQIIALPMTWCMINERTNISGMIFSLYIYIYTWRFLKSAVVRVIGHYAQTSGKLLDD